ncbi:enoyl-CoA hydratase/isomerase family protein [Patulibacter sp.]|uniref:enoyl-CoA hydratase/isomerase family protein n=1 Tax=Patulibacter sp. TaxID=1912859 RepID=UPI0027231CCA|nr:enoyl-CoA hydratase-related protein [Patulibacter sp.]MDO9409373.1 enoyl-CoA hydratase-related protein [Patulibacter sp.]
MPDTDTDTTDHRVAVTFDDGRATITLVRPAARNAIDLLFTHQLLAAVDACAARTDLRVVVIVAEGDHFSVGGDLRHMAGLSHELADELGRMITPFHRALAMLADLEVPVVAGIQGAFAGGAMGIALVADVVVAADDLRVAAGFPALGLSGDGGTTWHLPHLVGLRRAQELMLENRVLDATEALEWGLVTRTVPRAELTAEVERTAARLAAGPTRSLARTARLLRTSATTTIGDRLVEERESMRELGGTADAREGVEAFFEKRAARFGNR